MAAIEGHSASTLLTLIRDRRSERGPFDPARRPAPEQIDMIIDAGSWAPTAHNMQNFEIVIVDDPERLGEIGAVTTRTDPIFLRENFAQLSFSEDELRAKGTGVLAAMFPAAWATPGANFAAIAAAADPTPLAISLQGCPCLLLVLYDHRMRAPASPGDALGFMSLGCVMENMWLAAQALGLGLQVLSVFSSPAVDADMRRILGYPDRLKIAYACRLGFPLAPRAYLRVRRATGDFVHRNCYAASPPR